MNPGRSVTPAPADQAAREAARPAPQAGAPRTVDSAELFLGQSLLLIRHLGEIYRLQTTRQGKLILTK